MTKTIYILGIESSCDDTSAAVLKDGVLLSNVTASQAVHESYGGVVPELASRAHQQNVVPVVYEAIKRAGITKEQLSAVAFTRGPGLMGSLLVGKQVIFFYFLKSPASCSFLYASKTIRYMSTFKSVIFTKCKLIICKIYLSIRSYSKKLSDSS